MHHTHSSDSHARNGAVLAARLRAHRRKRGALAGLFRQARRHPVVAGALVAVIGWLFSGSDSRHDRPRARPREAGHAHPSGAGSAIH
ncbi:MAG TPA: hypothetical protein VN725_02815 [Rhodanobacteraceae bacterium]|nr:hypothetical protein [Rhodanobacteraceae bacterium]